MTAKGDALLFVYGTLRRGFDGPMARWLAGQGAWSGVGWVAGRLFRVADYPGFVAGDGGRVTGDLFVLADPAEGLALLDEHEECSGRFPEPHEYRRERIIVHAAAGPVTAWTYVYAHPAESLELIAGGDFLGAI